MLLSIPVSIAIALMVMSAMGMSANLMSLGGIAVAIGMLVDGSVVMVENIFKHLSRPIVNTKTTPSNAQSTATQILRQPNSIAMASSCELRKRRTKWHDRHILAAMIILVVFMPLFSFQGVEAKLFEPMAISIMLAIISAVFVAIMVVLAISQLLFQSGY